MQIKAIVQRSYHLTLVRMDIIKGLQITNAGEGIEKRDPPTPLLVMYIGAAIMKNCIEVRHKTKNELPYDPAIPLLSIYLEKMKTLIKKNNAFTPVFISSVQSLSHVRLFASPWTAAHQVSLSIANSCPLSR